MSLHFAYRATKGATRFGWSGFGTIRILDCDPTTLNVDVGWTRQGNEHAMLDRAY